MKEYLFSVVISAVVLDAVCLIANEKYKKITEVAISVILVLSIILPLPGLIEKIGESIKLEEAVDGEESEFYKLSFEDGIRQYISEKFSLSPANIEVEAVGFSVDEMRAERILITLKGTASLVYNKRIKKAVDELGLGEAEVKIEI